MRLLFVALLVSLANANANVNANEGGMSIVVEQEQQQQEQQEQELRDLQDGNNSNNGPVVNNETPPAAPQTADILYARWFQDTPKITYDQYENVFTLDFVESSDLNTDENMSVVFYDNKCRWDGETQDFEEIRLTNTEIYKPGYEGTFPYMEMTPNDAIPAVWRPVLVFQMDVASLAQNPAIYTANEEGEGAMRLCVRSSLGYGSTTMVGNSDDPVKVPPFQEVNFIESLLTIRYDLTAGFDVDAFAVEPKIREEVTAVKDTTYELLAYLCDPDDLEEPGARDPPRDAPLPRDLTPEYVPAEGGGRRPDGGRSFVQGALITICVAPDDLTYADGIRMNGLTEFAWSRYDPILIEQPAIADKLPSSNYLTSYLPETCEGGAEYCMFSSVLWADFYRSKGETGGAGAADLQFKPSRQRTLQLQRRLQKRQREHLLEQQQQQLQLQPLDDDGGGSGSGSGGGGMMEDNNVDEIEIERAIKIEQTLEQLQRNRRLKESSSFGVSVPIEETTYTGPPPLKTSGGSSLSLGGRSGVVYSVLALSVAMALILDASAPLLG